MNKKELKQIVAEGEGYRIEFKEKVANLDKEIVAFANSSGGRIFIGVRDDGAVVGVTKPNRLKSEIETIARHCDPVIKITIESAENILIVHIKEGRDRPYRCKAGFYSRIGANSQKLTRDEIVGLFISEGRVRYDELINTKFLYKTHFDLKKFDRFLQLADITKLLKIPALLLNLGVAESKKGKLVFNNAGILLFAKNLQDIYYHTTVTCALFKGTEKIEVLDRKDFNEDLVSNIDDTMNFLKKHISVRYEMTGTARRKEIPEIPFDALREAVINAVVHRDYFEKGANVMVEIFDDRIEISNPGGLVKGLKPQDVGKKSILRNPLLAGLLNRIKYIEKMGTGIKRMQKLMKEAGLRPVKFHFDSFFTAIFKKPSYDLKEIERGGPKKVVRRGGQQRWSELTKKQLGVMRIIKENPSISRKALSLQLGINESAVQKHIEHLKTKEAIRRIGPAKGGHWEIIST